MATMSLFMNLFENCNNIICGESDEEHFSENQISILFFISVISQIINFKV